MKSKEIFLVLETGRRTGAEFVTLPKDQRDPLLFGRQCNSQDVRRHAQKELRTGPALPGTCASSQATVSAFASPRWQYQTELLDPIQAAGEDWKNAYANAGLQSNSLKTPFS